MGPKVDRVLDRDSGDEDAGHPPDDAATKKSIGTLRSVRGHFTRALKSVDRAVDWARANPSSEGCDMCQKVLSDLDRYRTRCSDLYLELGALPQYSNDAMMKMDSLENDYEVAREMLLSVIVRMNKAAVPAPAAAPVVAQGGGGALPGAGKWKIQSALQPTKLTREATPTEMKAWARKLKSFFNISMLENATVIDQQAFFFSFLDLDLEITVRQEIDDATPVFGINGSCMSHLVERFRVTYPLFTCRLDFFKYQQSRGQSFSEFHAILRQKGDEADLQTLKIDDLYVFRIIQGCSDSKLREKFLKLKEPTLEMLVDESTRYEIAKRSLKACGEDRGQQRPLGAGSPRPQEAKQVSYAHLQGKCGRCGRGTHQSKDQCTAIGKTCKACDKVGHIARGPGGIAVCSTLAGTPPSGAGGKPNKKDKSSSKAQVKAAEEDKTEVLMVRETAKPHAPTVKLPILFTTTKGFSFDYDCVCDTGATRTLMSYDIVKDLDLGDLINRDAAVNMINASGDQMECMGLLPLEMTSAVHGRVAKVDVVITQSMKSEVLLSCQDLMTLGVIPQSFPFARAVYDVPLDSLEKIKVDFSDVLGDELDEACGAMRGTPMVIYLKDPLPVRPLNVKTTRPTPIHLTEAADLLITELCKAGVLKPVSGPSEWCSMAHFVPKAGGKKVRLVTDYRVLNKCVIRPTHPFPAAAELVKRVQPTSRFFAKVDAVHGYFQIPLSEESSLLTTFLTPRGRFRYRGAPMGLNSSSDEFCQRTDEAVAGLEEFLLKIVDDMCVQAETLPQLWSRLRIVLQRCRSAGIRISYAKLETGTSIKFAGYIISGDGIRPDPEKVEAIKCFPRPTNVSEMRSFLGLVNQLTHFIPDVSHICVLLRGLLKKDVAWVWLPSHEEAFINARELLCSPMLVFPFDPRLETELLTDASRLHGIGYALLQRVPEGGIRLVSCGSRSLTSCQRNYAVIELEAMAIMWAVQKSEFYLRGIGHFVVITDHKPLVSIFEKPLSEIPNERLTRFREKLVDYNFTVNWTPGKDHLIADALSRAPVFPGEEEDGEPERHYVRFTQLTDSLSIFYEHAATPVYERLVNGIREDVHPKSTAGLELFASVWDDLSLLEQSTQGTLVVYQAHRIVVPVGARPHVLELLHKSHCGTRKTYESARQLYYWPNMKNDIKLVCDSCEACIAFKPSQAREPYQLTHADGPMSELGVDLYDFQGQDWIVLVDRFSGWPWTARLTSTTTDDVTRWLSTIFVEHGFPEVIRSDNGPQFRNKFADWCSDHWIRHETSSPYYPQSNGLAEAAVKAVKHLKKKCVLKGEPFSVALLEWRNTPRADGISPAQAFLGRRQRTRLPGIIPKASWWDDVGVTRTLDADKLVKNDKARPLKIFEVGQLVYVQSPKTKTWDEQGTILALCESGHSYFIQMPEKIIRRNRRFIRAAISPLSMSSHDSQNSQDEESVFVESGADSSPSTSSPLQGRAGGADNSATSKNSSGSRPGATRRRSRRLMDKANAERRLKAAESASTRH